MVCSGGMDAIRCEHVRKRTREAAAPVRSMRVHDNCNQCRTSGLFCDHSKLRMKCRKSTKLFCRGKTAMRLLTVLVLFGGKVFSFEEYDSSKWQHEECYHGETFNSRALRVSLFKLVQLRQPLVASPSQEYTCDEQDRVCVIRDPIQYPFGMTERRCFQPLRRRRVQNLFFNGPRKRTNRNNLLFAEAPMSLNGTFWIPGVVMSARRRNFGQISVKGDAIARNPLFFGDFKLPFCFQFGDPRWQRSVVEPICLTAEMNYYGCTMCVRPVNCTGSTAGLMFRYRAGLQHAQARSLAACFSRR